MVDSQVVETAKKLRPLLILGVILGLFVIPFLEKKADSANRWLRGTKTRKKR